MSNFKEFPEILAMLIFLPVGVFMGHMMNFIQTTLYASNAYQDVKFWPFILGGAAAILTGVTHLAIKQKYKQYKYEHMYFQMVGLIMLLISGILLMIEEHLQTVAYLGFVAHGIIYVSALSYINIRTGKSKYRYLKLSVPHVVYLIGISIGSTLVWTSNDIAFYEDPNNIWSNYYYSGSLTGTVLLITSSAIFGGFLINEILQYGTRSYNYKESLDEDINRENANKEILKNKYFHITPQHLNFPAQVQLRDIPLKTESSGIKELGIILYALSSKVITMMLFYYPFIYLHNIASTLAFDEKIYQGNWFGTVGIVISLIFMALINYKITYLLSIMIKIAFMVVILIFFSYDSIYWSDIKILFWFVFVGLGFGFSHPDINILSYTNLISNEIVLAIGYFIEHLIIGLIQYYTLFHPLDIFDTSSNFNMVFAHALTFIIILIGLGLLGIFVIPNGKHSSLLEIKNILNNCANINQLVNTGNYDGQQNPQLYWQQQMYLQQNYPQIAPIQPQVLPSAYDPNNSAYRPPYPQNMFMYGRPGEQSNLPPPQQYQQHPPSQYQQTPYINTTYPNQMNKASGPDNNVPRPQNNVQGPYHNPPTNYLQTENNTTPAVAMKPQQNHQNLPLNIAPLTDNSFSPPFNYDEKIARPIIPRVNIK